MNPLLKTLIILSVLLLALATGALCAITDAHASPIPTASPVVLGAEVCPTPTPGPSDVGPTDLEVEGLGSLVWMASFASVFVLMLALLKNNGRVL